MISIAVRAEAVAKRLEPFKQRLGKIAMFLGVGMATIGFPLQIYANWAARECKINVVLITFPLLVYLVRIPYQISVRAWYLLPADVLGFAATGMLLAQWALY